MNHHHQKCSSCHEQRSRVNKSAINFENSCLLVARTWRRRRPINVVDDVIDQCGAGKRMLSDEDVWIILIAANQIIQRTLNSSFSLSFEKHVHFSGSFSRSFCNTTKKIEESDKCLISLIPLYSTEKAPYWKLQLKPNRLRTDLFIEDRNLTWFNLTWTELNMEELPLKANHFSTTYKYLIYQVGPGCPIASFKKP